MRRRGRPPQSGTAEEKAARRREKVRLYVQAHRARTKHTVSDMSHPSSKSHQLYVSSPLLDLEPGARTRASNRLFSRICVTDRTTSETRGEDVNPVHFSVRIQQASSESIPIPATPYTMCLEPSGNKEVASALVGLFRVELLPKFVRIPSSEDVGSELVTPCSPWIVNAYEMAVAQESGAIRSCLLAVGLALTGLRYQDEGARIAGLTTYRQALRQVRHELQPFTKGEATGYLVPYLSCLAASMFELLHGGFTESLMQHMKGAASLIQLLPRDKEVSRRLSDLLLEDFCLYEIVFALRNRYPSPMRALRRARGARRYKVAGDSKSTTNNATVMGDLLDCFDEVPLIMSSIDTIAIAPSSPKKLAGLQREAGKLAMILKSLDAWQVRFQQRSGSILNRSADYRSTSSPFVQGQSYEIVFAWVYYLTFRLCTLETYVDVLIQIVQQCEHETHQAQPGMSCGRASTTPVEIHGAQELGHYGVHAQVKMNLSVNVLNESRLDLRQTIPHLLDMVAHFMPFSQGITGSCHVFIPLDKAKSTIRKEADRLQEDLESMSESVLAHKTAILNDLDQMTHCMTTCETLQNDLVQLGWSPKPDN